MKKKIDFKKVSKIMAIVMLAAIMGGANANAKVLDESNNIIPRPVTYKVQEGKFTFTKDTSIYVKGNNDEETAELMKIAEMLQEKISMSTGFQLNIIKDDNVPKGNILFTTISGSENQGDEGYNLTSSTENITISAFKPEGVFRGVQTLLQMLPDDIESRSKVSDIKWEVDNVIIQDKPQYSYRGLMIDVARHFFTIDEIKRQIDFASQYKINILHLHLSDDQGWRLEIKKYPDLTLIGGSTEVGGGKGGYYTQEEFKDLVKYANERYIEIIPEFDMPGHSNAALASYGFLNPDGRKKELYTGTEVGFSSFMTRSEKTYEFIEDIIKEVSVISPSKYIHIGGDEALSTKKSDYDYFVGRVSNIAKNYGKIPIGWDPIDTSPSINSSVILENWKDSNEQAVEKNMKMVIAIAKKAYLDMKYDKDTPYGLDWAGYISIETAYNWDPTDYAPENLVLGLEAPLWTETISTVEEMDYMIYPRLLGYAEIGWTPKNLRNWENYKERLRSQEKRFKLQGINYYRDSNIFVE